MISYPSLPPPSPTRSHTHTHTHTHRERERERGEEVIKEAAGMSAHLSVVFGKDIDVVNKDFCGGCKP